MKTTPSGWRPASNSRNRPTTSEEFAYHTLRTDILTGRLSAGARVVQSDVAQEMAISVTPVREAMRRLESEGLVELTAHRGATVRRLEIRQAREIYELRILLEPLLVDRSAAATTEAGESLANLCDLMDAAASVSEFAELNQAFHDGLLTLDDGWLSRIVRQLRLVSSPYVAFSLQAEPDLMLTSNAEHRKMLDAFVRGDLETARQLVIHHLSATMVTLEEHL